MRRTLLVLSLLALGACASAPEPAKEQASVKVTTLSYPSARTVEQVDSYHGIQIADPYRWLEELDAPDTRDWIAAQNALTQQYLGAVPQRGEIHARMTELWNYERFGLPSREGNRYFLTRNDGLQNQAVLYVMDALDGEPRMLLDPNTFSSDGTVALTGTEVSPDGKYLAYGTASGGSDWQEWRVRDIATGQDTGDVIQWVKFSGASWAKDGSGFYYGRYDEPKGENKLKAVNEFQKVYFHRIGTPQSADTLVYDRPDQPKWGFGAEVSEDGDYLILSVSQGTDERNRLFYRDLTTANAPMVELIADLEAAYEFIGNDGPVFWLRTNLDAPRYRVIAIDTRQPAKANWRTVVAQTDATLVRTTLVNRQFIGQYLRDARSEVRRYAIDGKDLGAIELPGIGAAAGFDGKSDGSETFYSYTSFTVPTDIYRLDLASGQSSLFRRPKVAFDPAQYETTQVFYTSKDGTRVPMFITAKKGLALDGQQPTLLYGYGGFNIPVTPAYTVPMATWLDRGGVYAVANLRGGGEYGETWHQAGTKLNKQNVFDDFIAAAEHLISAGYTNPQKLAIYGRSNGGLLAAATALQRPDLFRASLPTVGVLDMLRFNQFTIGWAWESDYGSPQKPDEFAALRAYSPLHNIQPGVRYPAMLIPTGDHDDRVYPAHSFKFTAALQAQAGPGTYLTRIETRAGHGAGKPTTMQIDEWTDMLSFLVRELGMR
ncbi:MAG: S9 family peptidase [Rhodanobacteraceae bacterium]|nr:S9 family peptidase [Rhodanobacteraceae bacterium]